MSVDGDRIRLSIDDREEDYGIEMIRVPGRHNVENVMAALAAARLLGCPQGKCAEAVRDFRGIPNRIELVRTLRGVRYYNDSKATNVDAAARAIEAFREPLILIAGGREKGGSYAPLAPLVRQRVKAAFLIGEAASSLETAFSGLTETRHATGLDEAVVGAGALAEEGDVVLLSPACSSFDMFRDYEDRGETFRRIVTALE